MMKHIISFDEFINVASKSQKSKEELRKDRKDKLDKILLNNKNIMEAYLTKELYVIFDYNENKISKVFVNEDEAKLEYNNIRDEKMKLFRPHFNFLSDEEFIVHFNMLRTVDVMTLEEAIEKIVEYTEESAIAPYMDDSL